jgi:hypothetical protein
MDHDCCSGHAHTPEEGTARPVAAPLFPPAEVEAFRADDTHGATVIVCLMVGIFTLGLVLYSIIAVWVA